MIECSIRYHTVLGFLPVYYLIDFVLYQNFRSGAFLLLSAGHGGFGHVVLCKNKLDGRHYAVKKIRLKDKSPPLNDRILR